VILESRPKLFVADGGHRVRTPAETRAALERHVSELTGTVRGVGRAAGIGIIHVFSADYNGPLGTTANQFSMEGDPAGSAGKGITEDQAWCSCVAEALERQSAHYRGDEPVVRASWAEMRARAVHPDALTLFSRRQYATRKTWNHSQLPANEVPVPFDKNEAVDWCAAWSLITGSVRYLPAAYAFMGYRRAAWCWGDSNGCASGNTIEEAILQGFLELVERDAVAIWWYNRLRRPGVDLESFENPAFAVLRADLKALGRTLHILDVTSDLHIPCMVAVSLKEDGSGIVLGFGAHLDAGIAALRAITELKQLLPHPDWPHARDGDKEWMEQVAIADQPCVLPDGNALKSVRDFASLAQADLRDDIQHCAAIVAGRGMEMLVLNLTRPEIAFPVVRVTVPGLRHFRPRFAPGRLYQVPVEMGWLPAPLSEDQLNPVPLRS
jgi:ribosomal protein S12 methylthiotransferase accessory factor